MSEDHRIPERTADELWDDAIVIDGLNVSNWDAEEVYRCLGESGVTAINATSAVWENCSQALDNIAAWYARAHEPSAGIMIAKSVDDIRAAKQCGKVGIILGWQNATPIENDLRRLEVFQRLGVRIIQLTYNERNLLGNGCYERHDDGLSRFGVDAVREMNRLGILIDLSHVGDVTTLEAARLSTQPVAATHANARAMFDHVRNKSDEALRMIAQKGGVVGANAFPLFFPKRFTATLSDYVDAVEDLIERIGVDHVAIGTDYTQCQSRSFFEWLFAQQGTKPQQEPLGYPEPLLHPTGMETPDKLRNVAAELFKRGYGTEEIRKVVGGNWLGLFERVWE